MKNTDLFNGDGTPHRSYLYAADLAIWLWTILFRGESCQPYNVGSEESITIADLANRVGQCFEKPMEVRITKAPVPGKLPERYVLSTKRAALLGLTATVTLKQAISKTLKFNQ